MCYNYNQLINNNHKELRQVEGTNEACRGKDNGVED